MHTRITCVICKKGKVMICDNYRAVTLLCTTYKILANILYLKLCSEEIIRESHGGFFEREGQLSIKCFTVRQILEEWWEQNIDVRQMFISSSGACGTVWRKEIWSEMHTLGILPPPTPSAPPPPPKMILVKLGRILNNEIYAKVKNGKHLSSVVCFILGNSPASEFHVPTFRNTLSFPYSLADRYEKWLGLRMLECLYRERFGSKIAWACWLRLFSSQTFSRINTPTFSNLVIFHAYPPMNMEQSVPKLRHIKFRRREITQKKAYNIQNTAKVLNQEFILWIEN
jgi:hypothetical protein